MDIVLMIAVSLGFGLLMTVLWTKYIGRKSTKGKRSRTGYEREEFTIDPTTVPEFKPTWAAPSSVSASSTAQPTK